MNNVSHYVASYIVHLYDITYSFALHLDLIWRVHPDVGSRGASRPGRQRHRYPHRRPAHESLRRKDHRQGNRHFVFVLLDFAAL